VSHYCPRRVYINAGSVYVLLHAVAEAAVGLPITLVLDTARSQKCAVVQALAESLGIELLDLPGYSPNLNLIERLWRFVRKPSPDSISYEDFARFTAVIDRCLDKLPKVHKGEMEMLLTHKLGGVLRLLKRMQPVWLQLYPS
jgi:transposase